MYKAIGVIELKSIPKGVEAADAALKSAGVEMVSSHPSCPGKYEIILSGSISNITAAVSHVNSKFEGFVIDSSVMGRIEEQVISALFGTPLAAAFFAMEVKVGKGITVEMLETVLHRNFNNSTFGLKLG